MEEVIKEESDGEGDIVTDLLKLGNVAMKMVFDDIVPPNELASHLETHEHDFRKGHYKFNGDELLILYPSVKKSSTDSSRGATQTYQKTNSDCHNIEEDDYDVDEDVDGGVDQCSNISYANREDGQSLLNQPLSGVQNQVMSEEILHLQQKLDQMQDIQYHNSRLSEENSTLHQQIYCQDEALTQCNANNEKLSRKIKSLQETLELKQMTLQENEEQISRLQEKKTELESNVKEYEYRMTKYKQHSEDLKLKMENLNSQLENIKETNKELKRQLAESQHNLTKAIEIKQDQEIQIAERYADLKNHQNQIQTLTNTIQELKMEKTELQSQLTASNQAFMRFKLSTECNERGDHGLMVPTSTPIKAHHSICMELKGVLHEEDHLPSPLCEKEYHDLGEMHPILYDDSYIEEGDSHISVSFKEELTRDTSKILDKFQSKQKEILDDIRKFIMTYTNKDSTSDFLSSLEGEMERLTKQVSALVKANQDTEKRFEEQKSLLQKLEDENWKLKKSSHGENFDFEKDKRLVILKDQIDQERANIKYLEKKLKEKDAALSLSNKKFKGEKVLRSEIRRLQSLNKELANKNKNLEVKITGLREEVVHAHQDLEIQQRKSHQHQMRDHSSLSGKENRSHLMNMYGDAKYNQKEIELPLGVQTKKSYEKKKRTSNELQHLWQEKCRGNSPLTIIPQNCDMYDVTKRRLSYQVAIDNRTAEEERYPRCRSGSFAAATDNQHCMVEEERHSRLRSGSFLAATDNQHCMVEEEQHSRLRSGSFLAAIESGQEVMELKNFSCTSVDSSFSSHYSSAGSYSNCDSFYTNPKSSGNFTVNSNYLTCTDSSHNHSSSKCEAIKQPVSDIDNQEAKHYGTDWRPVPQYDTSTEEDHSFHNKHIVAPDVIQFSTERSLIDDIENTIANRQQDTSSKCRLNTACQTEGIIVAVDDCQSEVKSGHVNDHKYVVCKMEPDNGQQSDQKADIEKMKSKENEDKEQRDDNVNMVRIVSDQNDGGVNISKSVSDEEKKIPQISDINEEVNTPNVSMTACLVEQLQKLNLNENNDAEERKIKSDANDSQQKSTEDLKKIRQENLEKRREQMKFLRMPDLNEAQEQQGTSARSSSTEHNNNSQKSSNIEHNGELLPQINMMDNPVTPSIPESFLQNLGIETQNESEETSPDQLTDEEIENKFTSLSLAFKTDKITLEKRLEIQERSRDIAEENVAKEIKGLRDALEHLNQICLDSQVRDVLLKIQKHVNVLEQSSARVSSRAEVFGAVQQERRMSKAIEIMLTHVDNLRMAHDRQTSELEEAKRMIQDNKPFGGSTELGLSRRSASVCQANMLSPKGARRRVSDAAIPRGGLQLSHSASMDPRSKFQQLATVAALKNSTTAAFRKSSLHKQTSTTTLLSQRSSQDSNSDSKNSSKQKSAEEEAFQKGFEQGYKAQITGELKHLREQQNSITDTLEDIRDKCDEDEVQSEISLQETVITKVWEHIPEWNTASKKLRLSMVIFFFFMAACSVILSFFPVGQAAVQVYPEYHHVNQPPV